MSNPLTYPASRLPFSLETFSSPPAEYRGAPFWAWVTAQELEKTVEQIDVMRKMGMGGFHIHTRVGLDIEYMGEQYMKIVKACVKRAGELGMGAFLYDEDRWPSGFAGGQTLKDHPELKGLHLLWTPWPYGSEVPYEISKYPVANAAPVRSELGHLLAIYAVTLQSGLLASSRLISSASEAKPEEAVWYAYIEPNPPSEYMGDDTLPDLLRPDTTRRFIETTHEKYKSAVGDEFGTTVPSMYTDEPQYCPMSTLNSAGKGQDIFLPWTEGILGSFKATKGADLMALLPKIIWDGEEVPVERYWFLDHVAELFAENYMGVMARWCTDNGILMTGHLNSEATLASQTAQNGECMRHYRDMGLPGIDMLCDNYEFNTAKQATSVSRQYGRSGVMSELYGVTGWQFTFEGHKGQGDWQAALGVTLRVPHLFWSSMRGEAKRDYPACIGYQSPWWEEYHTVETHFARVNTALTRGKAVTRIAVIHPVESFWLCFGPKDTAGEEMTWRDEMFKELTRWLVLGHVDFDFISESLFPELTPLGGITGTKLRVGECAYDVVILPNLRTLRSTTLERVQHFAKAGGKVIIAGMAPTLIDAQQPSSPPSIPGSRTVPWSKDAILRSLADYRDIDMVVSETTLYRTQGARADSLIYQMRNDGDENFVFICNVDRDEACPVEITLMGEHKVEVLDTLTGTSWELAAALQGGRTILKWYFDGCESLLLRLTSGGPSPSRQVQKVLRTEFTQAGDVKLESITLSEPNALLLDHCTFKFGNGNWEPETEILRIDQLLRHRLNYHKKGAKFRQPHTIPQSARKPAGDLRLKFTFASDFEVSGAYLGIEDYDQIEIILDGVKVANERAGWWVDNDISKVPLPTIVPGKHTVELVYQYGRLTNLERIYILGDFGVKLRGKTAKIVSLNLNEMEWGDITRQELPFYTGNITYHCYFTPATFSEETVLRVAHFASPCIAVDIDGSRAGLIIHQPRGINLGVLRHREYIVAFTCFGNRYNAFGALHLVPNMTNWLGGDTWRSEGDWWSEEYVLGPVGILNCPRVMKPGREKSSLPRRPRKVDTY